MHYKKVLHTKIVMPHETPTKGCEQQQANDGFSVQLPRFVVGLKGMTFEI